MNFNFLKKFRKMPVSGHFSIFNCVVAPFWIRRGAMYSWLTLICIVGIDLLIVYRSILLTYWQKRFYDVLSDKLVNEFAGLLIELAMLGGVAIILDYLRSWFLLTVEIEWRDWLTRFYLDRWIVFDANTGSEIENPEQRISEDVRVLVENILSLSLGLLGNFVSFLSFSTIVYSLSGVVEFFIFGGNFYVEGYMLWCAIFYALCGSVIMELLSRRLVLADYNQKKSEGYFRSELFRVRDYKLEIAMSGGIDYGKKTLSICFDDIKKNWIDLIKYTKRVTAFDRLYTEAGAFIPYLLAGPMYFSGKITLGDLMQLTQSFMRVRASLSWFVYRYKDIAVLRATLNRLVEFYHKTSQDHLIPFEISSSVANGLECRDVVLRRPDGQVIVNSFNLNVFKGERWLVQGMSGSGKTSFLRAISGTWCWGSGEIIKSHDAMIVSQRTFIPRGNVEAFLCYPFWIEKFTRDKYEEVISMVSMSFLSDLLFSDQDWYRKISPGQLQRLLFARVILHEPDIVFLDEATSALDDESESELYGILINTLPEITIVSIGHGSSLIKFHQRFVEIKDGILNVINLPRQ